MIHRFKLVANYQVQKENALKISKNEDYCSSLGNMHQWPDALTDVEEGPQRGTLPAMFVCARCVCSRHWAPDTDRLGSLRTLPSGTWRP